VVLEKDGEDQLDRSRENEEVLHRVKEKKNMLRATKRRKAKWIGHTLRRNCRPKYVIDGNIEGMRRR
jgi:hypothetical protein